MESKFTEFTTEVGKDKDVRAKQLGDMTKSLEGLRAQVAQIGSNFDEIKLMMLSLHKHHRIPERPSGLDPLRTPLTAGSILQEEVIQIHPGESSHTSLSHSTSTPVTHSNIPVTSQ